LCGSTCAEYFDYSPLTTLQTSPPNPLLSTAHTATKSDYILITVPSSSKDEVIQKYSGHGSLSRPIAHKIDIWVDMINVLGNGSYPCLILIMYIEGQEERNM
jgi:hypothetical protein